MKKLLLLAVFSVLGLSQLSAQVSFSHAIGIKYYIVTLPSQTVEVAGVSFETESLSSSSAGILYSPRLNFVEIGDNSTISLGTHLGLAFQIESQGESSFTYDVPLVAEYNFGQASNNDNDSSFGFYVGAGYGIHNSSMLSEAVSGPIANGGIRFLIADLPLDLNVSYLVGSDSLNVLGVGVQYAF